MSAWCRRVCGVVLLGAVGCAPAAVAPPRTLPAQPGNLEGVWRFRTDPENVGEKQGWQAADYDDGDWKTLDVPGYWEAQGVTDPRPGEAPKPKGNLPWTDYDGVGWYRLTFVVPAEWAGKALRLNLGSIDDEDRTFVNGQLVGATGPGVQNAVGRWRAYDVPATSIKAGAANVIAVQVTDLGGPGGFMGPLVSLLPADLEARMATLPSRDRPLAERFADPPGDNRILKITHDWPDQPEAATMLLQKLLADGFGGVVTNVDFTNYLQDEGAWTALQRIVGQAKDAGMALWLYDEQGYPSVLAGGQVLEAHPEWQARGLLISDAITSGEAVTLQKPPGDVRLAAAFPVDEGTIRLDGQVDLSGGLKGDSVTWTPPPGTWHAMLVTEAPLYEGTHAAMNLARHQPYPNLLLPEVTQLFLRLTHDRYAAHFGQDLGRTFESTFTDEPSLMSAFLQQQPWKVLPWAPNLPAAFEQRSGQSLEPWVPALIADAGPEGRRARYDFWHTVADLTSRSYFGQIREWCDQHDIKSGGHLLYEEPLLLHVPLYGDFFACARELTAPSIDCLTSLPAQVPPKIGRLLSSAGELEGNTLTMCETSDFSQVYRPAGDERPKTIVTEDQIRGTINRLMVSGINTITSYYTFTGLSSQQLRRLNLWTGRCSTMLRGGHQVADIAVVYPIESVWPHNDPSNHNGTADVAAARIAHAYDSVAATLWAAGRDYTYIDSRAIREARVDGGVLRHGDLAWRVVVLPGVETLPDEAWQKLDAFQRGGGVVIEVAAKPHNSAAEFPSATVEDLGRAMFGEGDAPVCQRREAGLGVYLPEGSEALLGSLLDKLIEQDVAPSAAAPLRVTHRFVGGQDVYFVINDSDQPWQGEVTVAADGAGQRWDPATGETAPLAGPTVPLELEPYGGMLLTYAKPRERELHLDRAGALPLPTPTALPAGTPSVGKGTYVQADPPASETMAGVEGPVWHSVATLTKGDTDTFMFLSFRFDPPADLSGVDQLVIDSWVPEGQATPAQLLVIVQDQDGGQYLANTGRPLSRGGHQQIWLRLDQIEPAGWATDPNGHLDVDHVAAISLGWGGYLGREGERIELTVAPPRVARVAP